MKKAIKGFESLYEIDEQGNVYSLIQNSSRRKRIIKPYENGTGYYKVNLYDSEGKCKKKYVHRLVAETFILNPSELNEVNHKDCNKANNCVENLEWCDRKQNLQHSYDMGMKREGEKHGCHKLTQKQVNEIRSERNLTQKQMSEKFGVKQCTISAILTGRLWKKGGDSECRV